MVKTDYILFDLNYDLSVLLNHFIFKFSLIPSYDESNHAVTSSSHKKFLLIITFRIKSMIEFHFVNFISFCLYLLYYFKTLVLKRVISLLIFLLFFYSEKHEVLSIQKKIVTYKILLHIYQEVSIYFDMKKLPILKVCF